MRDLCKKCQQRPQAINYHKNGKVYYRSVCDSCARGRPHVQPLWTVVGYKKKLACDRCGFASRFPEQFSIFFLDGNLRNCLPTNLKTICANCQRLIQKKDERWRQGDLIPDRPTKQ